MLSLFSSQQQFTKWIGQEKSQQVHFYHPFFLKAMTYYKRIYFHVLLKPATFLLQLYKNQFYHFRDFKQVLAL